MKRFPLFLLPICLLLALSASAHAQRRGGCANGNCGAGNAQPQSFFQGQGYSSPQVYYGDGGPVYRTQPGQHYRTSYYAATPAGPDGQNGQGGPAMAYVMGQDVYVLKACAAYTHANGQVYSQEWKKIGSLCACDPPLKAPLVQPDKK